MENEELENLIETINEAMHLLADVDLYSQTNKSALRVSQKKVIKCYDILYKTKNHLKYLKKIRGIK